MDRDYDSFLLTKLDLINFANILINSTYSDDTSGGSDIDAVYSTSSIKFKKWSRFDNGSSRCAKETHIH